LHDTTIMDIAEIDRIRAASRLIVRELGFLNDGLAGTDLSPSAVHALIELGHGSVGNAAQLGQVLGLEKSTVSRLLGKLTSLGLTVSRVHGDDARVRTLELTEAGRVQFGKIEAYGRGQVAQALAALPEPARDAIGDGLAAYADALCRRRAECVAPAAPGGRPDVRTGYEPMLLARIVELHAGYYARRHGFGQAFECQVASGLAEFLGRINRPQNLILHAHLGGAIAGAAAIDGEILGSGVAQLRWFVVDQRVQGRGIGTALLDAALAQVDHLGIAETRLWTFKGLDAARRLYEKAGFVLSEERAGRQWGPEVLEQQFVRNVRRAGAAPAA